MMALFAFKVMLFPVKLLFLPMKLAFKPLSLVLSTTKIVYLAGGAVAIGGIFVGVWAKNPELFGTSCVAVLIWSGTYSFLYGGDE